MRATRIALISSVLVGALSATIFACSSDETPGGTVTPGRDSGTDSTTPPPPLPPPPPPPPPVDAGDGAAPSNCQLLCAKSFQAVAGGCDGGPPAGDGGARSLQACVADCTAFAAGALGRGCTNEATAFVGCVLNPNTTGFACTPFSPYPFPTACASRYVITQQCTSKDDAGCVGPPIPACARGNTCTGTTGNVSVAEVDGIIAACAGGDAGGAFRLGCSATSANSAGGCRKGPVNDAGVCAQYQTTWTFYTDGGGVTEAGVATACVADGGTYVPAP
jgi:hypothetical protein